MKRLLCIAFSLIVGASSAVAQVADLTLFWILLALFVAQSRIIANPPEASQPTAAGPNPGSSSRRQRRAAPAPRLAADTQFLGRMALLVGLAAVIGLVTWTKDVNYLRAALTVSEVNSAFADYDFPASLDGLDRAVALAPDVATYYNYRAAVYNNLRTDPTLPPNGSASCGERTDCMKFVWRRRHIRTIAARWSSDLFIYRPVWT